MTGCVSQEMGSLEPAAGGELTTLEADVVLVSAGRVPLTAGLQLEKMGFAFSTQAKRLRKS